MIVSSLCRIGSRYFTPQSRRHLSHFRVVEHIVPASYVRTYPGAIEPGAENNLRLAVKQYIPRNQLDSASKCNPVTIIGAHANGFPKELYEPFWDDLYENLHSQGQSIQSIWIADIAHQGQSGKLNESILGNDPNWWDHARDLLYFINRKQGQMPQPLMGVGHSMGASILVAVALLHPSLFQSLVLLDPVIQTENPSKEFAPPSTHRRDQWPSRDAAREAFLKSKFYQAWDSRVFDKWMVHGLSFEPKANGSVPKAESMAGNGSTVPLCRDAALHEQPDEDQLNHDNTTSTPVVLSTTKAQEVFHYLRPLYKVTSASDTLRQRIYPDIDNSTIEDGYDFYRPEPAEIFHRLPHLRPSVLYCFGKSSPFTASELRHKKMRTTGIGPGGSGGSSNGRVVEAILNTGHMIPFEDVHTSAELAAQWIDKETVRWQAIHDEWIRLWKNTKPKGEIDDDWLKRMPRPEKRSPSKKK